MKSSPSSRSFARTPRGKPRGASRNSRSSRTPSSAAAGKDAARYGFSPEAGADQNVTALQEALNGGGIVSVARPGVYDLNNTVFLDSDTRLTCAPGVIFRKAAPYCNVLVNRGALTKEYNENITVEGLELSVNGQEAMPTLVYGLRAQMGFFYVKNLTIRNFTCADGGPRQYLFYIVTWSNLLVENVRLVGDKDGIKLNNGHDAIIRNLDLTTYDDGTSLCGTDYPTTLLEVGDVYNVCYSNVTDHQYKNIFGRTCLILPGSWANYRKGNEYGAGDFCLHEGRLYQSVNNAGFKAVAVAAPIHGSGVGIGADNIAWRFIQPCEFHRTNVYNVTFDNCIFEKSGNLIVSWGLPEWYYRQYDCIHRPFYPGTERDSSVWGISLRNCRVTGAGPQVLVNVMGNMKDVSMEGCFFNNSRCTVINVDQDSCNEELIATLNGCTFLEIGRKPEVGADTDLPDYEGCPILRRDIDDTGKLVVARNGGAVHCHAAGNSYRGPAFECGVSKGSRLRFSSMDMPLKNLTVLSPRIGDTCRAPDGLYVYTAAGWKNLSA